MWGEYGSKDFRCTERRHRKTGTELHIQLKAKRNSTTVVVNTLASENPDEAGRYSMDVEHGQYSVILLVGVPAITCRDHYRV
ncbi:prophage tail fiber N-terminal domain-containing protein [Escherichia coli]|uniref:prophage tail fiber N-terminal domain-containing protein n=1 Tax=Escherichia coli TaxID=562 RepID=UPI002FCD22A3